MDWFTEDVAMRFLDLGVWGGIMLFLLCVLWLGAWIWRGAIIAKVKHQIDDDVG